MKILIIVLLILPSLLLTGVIWVLGGWTKGWDYMPNPTYTLVDWGMR